MSRINRWVVFVLIFAGSVFNACQKDKDPVEISCNKTVIEGDWTVDVEDTQYFEAQDSTVVDMRSYTTTFKSDGTGFSESLITSHFTWSLQCTPHTLLINKLGGGPLGEDPDDDPMNYLAFSNFFQLTKITANEILMSSEYVLGNNDTRRKVTLNLTYSRTL